MWPARIALICLLLAALVGSAAFAQFNQCGRGFCPNGVFSPGFRPPSPPAAGGCDGSVDLSNGCPQPMLGL